MQEALTMPALKAVFSFPFQERNWPSRFLIGAALLVAGYIIPIVPVIFVFGYVVRVLRQALEGKDLTLPMWDDWGRLGSDGLRAFVVGLVYLLPGTVVYLAGFAVYIASSYGFFLFTETASEPSGAALAAPFAYLGGLAIFFLAFLVGTVLLVLGAIPLPVALAHATAKDRLGAAFSVREWWPYLRQNRLGYFITWLLVFGLGQLVNLTSMIIAYTGVCCCLVPLVSAPIYLYLLLVGGGLFGLTYRESVAIAPAGS